MSISQASQDLFVCYMNQYKHNGRFLEIGANDPIKHSNTYKLETEYNWRGLMIEYDKSFSSLYDIHRPKSSYIIDFAQKVDYKTVLDTQGFPKNIDYLQIDLDVDNKSTLDTLQKLDETVFDSYRFGTVTFEHDIYLGNFFNTRQLSRDIFAKRGYLLVCPDVKVSWLGQDVAFEDWYIHPSLVPEYIYKPVMHSESLHHNEIVAKFIV